MAHNSNNVRGATSGYDVWTAAYGTTLPTNLPPSSPASFYAFGLLTDNGLSETYSNNESNVFDMLGQLQRKMRNQEVRQFTFEALEENAVVLGIKFPGSTLTSSGGTAEVQTVTISGTPTAGTFSLALSGYGNATGLAYNISTSALATALSNAFGITVTVTGTAGTTYTVTFPTNAGNVPQMTADGSGLTPNTATVAVATTTPGVSGTNTRLVGSATAVNRRAWVLDVVDGLVSKRWAVPNGEAVWTGTTGYTSSGAAIGQFTLTAYPDTSINNAYYKLIDNDPAMAETFS